MALAKPMPPLSPNWHFAIIFTPLDEKLKIKFYQWLIWATSIFFRNDWLSGVFWIREPRLIWYHILIFLGGVHSGWGKIRDQSPTSQTLSLAPKLVQRFLILTESVASNSIERRWRRSCRFTQILIIYSTQITPIFFWWKISLRQAVAELVSASPCPQTCEGTACRPQTCEGSRVQGKPLNSADRYKSAYKALWVIPFIHGSYISVRTRKILNIRCKP